MKKGRAKSLGIFAIKLVGTVLFLWWALSQVEDRTALWENFCLALGSPLWVAAGLGFAFLSLLANALRWHYLLLAQSIRQPFSYIFRLTLYGAFFNIASLGGAAGDAAKIVLLIRRMPGKKVGITVSVMVDHIVGFISSAMIFLVFTWGFRTIDSVDDVAGRGTFVAATWFQAAGIVGLVLSVLSGSPFMLKWGRKYFPKITCNRWVDMITSALDLYRTGWKFVFFSLIASFVLSASYYLTFFAGLRSLGQVIEAAQIMSVMPIVDAVTALPISVSGLGVRERTFDFLIGKLTGIPTAAAVAGSLIGFLFTLFWGLVGGIAILTARSDKNVVEESVDE